MRELSTSEWLQRIPAMRKDPAALAPLSACQDEVFAPNYAAMSHGGGWTLRVLVFVPAAVFLVLLLQDIPAVAAKRDAREREARKACLKGDYSKGVDLLVDLFVDTKDPTYIFNQGRCFEQNSRFKDAIARFEEYLRLPSAKLSSEDRVVAEKHIADCKDKLPPEREDSSTQLPPPPHVAAPTSPSPAETSPRTLPSPEPATPVVAKPAQQPPQRRWGLLTAGIATGIVGVGAVVGGVVLNLKANQMASDFETKPGTYSSGKENDQKNYKTLSMVGYGVGAACVVGAAILIGYGAHASTSPFGEVAFVPTVGADRMGAMLTGAF